MSAMVITANIVNVVAPICFFGGIALGGMLYLRVKRHIEAALTRRQQVLIGTLGAIVAMFSCMVPVWLFRSAGGAEIASAGLWGFCGGFLTAVVNFARHSKP